MKIVVVLAFTVCFVRLRADETGGKKTVVKELKRPVDDVEDVNKKGLARPDDPKHPKALRIEEMKTVNLKPELAEDEVTKVKGKKKRPLKKGKFVGRGEKPGRRIQNKLRNKKQGKVNKKGQAGKKVGPKNKNLKRRRFRARARKRQMRKLTPKQHKNIVDRIVAEHKSGKGSTITTQYLQERVRALLQSQGFLRPKCDTKPKKINRRRKFPRRLKANRKNKKQSRLLKRRLGKKKKAALKKTKKTTKKTQGKRRGLRKRKGGIKNNEGKTVNKKNKKKQQPLPEQKMANSVGA